MSSPLSAASPSASSDDATNNAKGQETGNKANTDTNPGETMSKGKQQDGPEQHPPQEVTARASGIEIYIHSPTTTTSSGGGLDGGPLSPQTISMAQYSRPKIFRKLSNSSSILSEIFRHPSDDISEQRLRAKIKRANGRDNYSKDLIEFLRTTSPPPRPSRCRRLSFSLNPYGGGGGGNRSSSSSFCGGRRTAKIPFWAVCRRLKARRGSQQHGKQKRKEISEKSSVAVLPDAPLLKLPDSAVAGRTVGGHQHIAISIPVEYDHLGEEETRTEGPSSSGAVVRPAASPSISTERVPARTSSAAMADRSSSVVNSVKPQPMIRSHTSAGSSSLLPRQTGDLRPRTADPLACQSQMGSFDSRSPIPSQPNSAMEVHYPVVRNQHSFGYTNAIGYHESPDGVSFQRHHHWSWPSGGPQSGQPEQTSFSLDNNPEAMLSNAMAFHLPHSCCSPVTGIVSKMQRGQSMSMLPFSYPHPSPASNSDLRAQKSMAQLSYHEIINHHNSYPDLSNSGLEGTLGAEKIAGSPPQLQTMRSLTFNLPPGYQLGGQTPAGAKPLSNKSSGGDNSVEATKEQSGVKEPEPEPPRLRLSSIMTVAEVKPSFSVEASPIPGRKTDNAVQAPASKVLSPQPTRVHRVLSVESITADSPIISSPSSVLRPPTMEGDGESTPKASSSFAARSARQEQHMLSAVMVDRHRPSIEEVLFPSPIPSPIPSSDIIGDGRSPTPRVADIVPLKGDSPRPAPTPTVPAATSRPAVPTPARASKRTASHQALAKQYAALSENRDQEMTILLDRLERLENKNDWWLNSVVPMVENMTRRLTRVYDGESLPRMAREKERATAAATGSGSGGVSNRSASAEEPAAVHRYFSDNRVDYKDLSTESSLDSLLPPLTLSRPSEFQSQATSQGHPSGEGRRSLLEPESSHESFDSFNFDRRRYPSRLHQQHSNRPNTSIAPPSPTQFEPEPEPSYPYPYPYIYPGESHEELEQERFYPLQVPGVGVGVGVSEGRNAGHVSMSRLRYNSSNDSLPQGGFLGPPINMGMGMDMRSSISSTWDHQPDYHRPHHYQAQPQPLQSPFQPPFQERAQTSFGHDNDNGNGGGSGSAYCFNRDFNFDFGHGMGLAVDRLPSRHGEKGLLNSVTVPGGSGGGSGGNSRDNTTPIGGRNSPYDHGQSRLSYSSSARTARPLPRPRPQSMFIPRRANYTADYAYGHGYDHGADENDTEQEYYDEDEDEAEAEAEFDDRRGSMFSETIRPSLSTTTTAGRKSKNNNARRVSFLQPLVQQGNSSASKSNSKSKVKARPISWPSSYRPQEAAQKQPQPIMRRREREEPMGPTNGPRRGSSDSHRRDYQQQQRQTEWDTLEPLMRGLTGAMKLDLELGRDLDLDLGFNSDVGFAETT